MGQTETDNACGQFTASNSRYEYERERFTSCPHCGTTYTSPQIAKWCSYRCCNDASILRQKHRRRLARQKKCSQCGVDFEANRADQLFCTSLCRIRHFRNKKKPSQLGS